MMRWALYSSRHPSFDTEEILFDFELGLTLEEVYVGLGLEFPPAVH